ncbi:MAG: ribosome-associated translation inhibitor RaiA [Planctomycetes bacterium]|nr:ribosome-associated translation inhibitor RaiA [Planctomycetota bacterium]
MQINITGRHFELSDAIRTYAAEKAEKLQKFFNGVTTTDILLKSEDRTFHCEIILHINNNPDVVIDVAHESMYAAIDLALDKAQRQLRRHKERVRGHHRHVERRELTSAEIAETEDDDEDFEE